VAKTLASQLDAEDVLALRDEPDCATDAGPRRRPVETAKDANGDVVYLYLFRRSDSRPAPWSSSPTPSRLTPTRTPTPTRETMSTPTATA
jgi:hypothetical protein